MFFISIKVNFNKIETQQLDKLLDIIEELSQSVLSGKFVFDTNIKIIKVDPK